MWSHTSAEADAPGKQSGRMHASQDRKRSLVRIGALGSCLWWAVLVLFTNGCGLGENTREFQNRELGPWEGGVESLPLVLWGSGEARLELELQGPGSIRATLNHGANHGQVLFEEELASGPNYIEVDLPGTGLRFFDVNIEASTQVRWTRGRVRESLPAETNRSREEKHDLLGRDVIVLVADSLVATHLGCYGHELDTSPVLDRLAAEGTMFTSASSQTSWTLPSVVSLFTSQEQERHGVLRLDQRLGSRLTTLAELFSEAGYRTVGLIQNGVIQASTGVDRGFDEYKIYDFDDRGADMLVEFAHAEIAAQERAPLFLYVHMLPPHGPYTPPERYEAEFVDEDYDGPVDGGLRSLQALIKRRPDPDHKDVKQLAALYDAYIRFVDEIWGRILEPTSDLSSREGPLVVITSDHGEAFFEHGAQGHNRNIYQEMVHVPLVFWMPDAQWPAGRSIRTPVSLLDVLPTFQELFALGETRQDRQGTSLAGVLMSNEQRSAVPLRPLFMTSRHSDNYESFHAGVRLGGYKFIRRTRKKGPVIEMLFDLVKDPAERDDISRDFPVRAAALSALLDRWFYDVGRVGLEQDQAEFDEERQKAIEAIGYTGDDG